MKEIQKNYSWIISDGTKGMENQSIALAKLLNINYEIILFKPHYLLNKFPLIGTFIPRSIIKIDIEKPSPKFIITTGRRMAGISLFIKKNFKHPIKNIHIQDPKIPYKYFDLLLIPEHDNIVGKNIINTKGALSFIDNNKTKRIDLPIPENIKSKKKTIILALIGGDNKRYKPNNTNYYNLGLDIIRACQKINGRLIISTSRRTPVIANKILHSMLKKYNVDYYFWSGKGYNPYPSMIRLANFIIVTSDSVNMISETASLDTPLFVAYLNKEKGKISNFLENLENLKIIKKFHGELFPYNKVKLNTNNETALKIDKFFCS